MNHTLTQEESNEVNRIHEQIAFCGLTGNPAKVISYPPFKRKMDALAVQLGIIEDHMPLKDVSGVGTTTGKLSLKVGFADFEINLTEKVYAFATDTDNITPETTVAMFQLANDMSRTRSEIIHMKDADIIGYANTIKTKATPYLAALFTQGYQIVAADFIEGINQATLFNNSIGIAHTIEDGGNVAGLDIHTAYVEIQVIQKALVLNNKHYKTIDTDFYNGFKTASVVDHLGHSLTKILGDITGGPNNIPLPFATVQNKRTLRFADVNILAHYEMKKMHGHLDNWEVKCDNYITKIQAIKTIQGKSITINFHLDPIVPAP